MELVLSVVALGVVSESEPSIESVGVEVSISLLSLVVSVESSFLKDFLFFKFFFHSLTQWYLKRWEKLKRNLK